MNPKNPIRDKPSRATMPSITTLALRRPNGVNIPAESPPDRQAPTTHWPARGRGSGMVVGKASN